MAGLPGIQGHQTQSHLKSLIIVIYMFKVDN